MSPMDRQVPGLMAATLRGMESGSGADVEQILRSAYVDDVSEVLAAESREAVELELTMRAMGSVVGVAVYIIKDLCERQGLDVFEELQGWAASMAEDDDDPGTDA